MSASSMPAPAGALHGPRQGTALLVVAALGVVFGDIGTSPLYALREAFDPKHGIPLNPDNVMGLLSLIPWSMAWTIALKYLTLMMRADNNGEGGILALLALALRETRAQTTVKWAIISIGIFGAAMFYGDSMITPAITVLSAVEGVAVAAPAFEHYVLPITVGVLALLFLIQSHGTTRVGALFGPITMLWFVSIGAVGAMHIARNSAVLAALNPKYAADFVIAYPFLGFIVLGAVFLALTGGEALYADMGHFGKRAIRIAWFGLVAPCLVLNYFGQGALLLVDPKALSNPFYLSFPGWALYPMVVLATAATIIASQATISGAYSMTQQAVQLGYLPRMSIRHTSERAIGQIYVPLVNWILLASVAAAVVGFGSSDRLASAYGVSVMGTMLVTTLLTFFVLRYNWRYPLLVASLATSFFMLIDATFFAAAMHKVFDGGW
ncbi:MAG TPA: KUP/HAK/KT family potassium transporter, partial [Usitatibacter sp.]|nr:KUP/HAK/KT family potassium transporter [Usitatibacter sp.]